MVRFNERPIGTIAFDESTTNGGGNSASDGFNIPRDKPIRRITLRFFWSITNGGSGVLDEDGVLNLIKGIRLVADGNKTLMHLSGRIAYFLEKYEKGTAPYFLDGTEASTTATAYATLILDFALNRKLEKELNALLMAHRFSSLKLFIDWGAVADAYSTTTGTSIVDANSGCEVEIREVSGVIEAGDASVQEGVNVRDLDPPQLIEQIKTIDLEASKLEFDSDAQAIDITPAPANILTQGFMALDNDVRTNARVTDIKIQRQSPETENIIEREWLSIWSENKSEYALESLETGFFILDYLDKLGVNGLRNVGNAGDIKLLLKTDGSVNISQDDIVIFTRSISGRAKPKNG